MTEIEKIEVPVISTNSSEEEDKEKEPKVWKKLGYKKA